MKLFISKLYATFLSFFYEGKVYFHHINKDGYWEFWIGYILPHTSYRIVRYKTKGVPYL